MQESTRAPLIKVGPVSHVGIVVDDVEKAAAWWERVFGIEGLPKRRRGVCGGGTRAGHGDDHDRATATTHAPSLAHG